jgi:hypothetical protein
MKKKLGGAVFAAAAVGAMLVAPAGAAPGHVPPSNTNSVAYWEYELDMDCTKTSIANVRKWYADGAYEAVVVKGGAVDSGWGKGVKVYMDVEMGDKIRAPKNNGGQVADISWLITCNPGDPYDDEDPEPES